VNRLSDDKFAKAVEMAVQKRPVRVIAREVGIHRDTAMRINRLVKAAYQEAGMPIWRTTTGGCKSKREFVHEITDAPPIMVPEHLRRRFDES
jgi:hypothetical protein